MAQGFVATVPEKRVVRTKHPAVFDDPDDRQTQTDALKKMLSILHKLQKHPYAGPFLQPVDAAVVPDYSDYVKDPVDLSTVESRLRAGRYTSAYEFSSDVRRVWSNSFLYNAQGSELYRATVELSAYFESLFRGHENLLFTDRNDAIEELYKQVEALKREIKDIKGTKPSGKAHDRPMTLQEKKVLGQNIRRLQPQHLRGLIALVKDSLQKDTHGQEVELDIDVLSPKACRDLEHYVSQCLALPLKRKNVSLLDVNAKLDTLATNGEESSSESSSSSGSELDPPPPLDIDMFGAGDYPPMWPSYPQKLAPNDQSDVGFIMDFDRP